jgi:very-short-patch-repair endonuclease
MDSLQEHKNKIITAYTKDLKSIRVIAGEYNTYGNKIRRFLLKNGVKLRDKSESQEIALKSGRHKHPTKGTNRTQEVKFKISESISEHWENISPEEYDKKVQKGKDIWNELPTEHKLKIRGMATEAIRKASKEGSKTELFLLKALKEHNIEVVFHKKSLIRNTNLELDMFLPSIKTAIEIDGPSHFFPIWGEEVLQKTIASDNEKNGLLLSSGYKIIRIKNLAKKLSQKRKRDILSMVLDAIALIESGKNKTDFIELELR